MNIRYYKFTYICVYRKNYRTRNERNSQFCQPTKGSEMKSWEERNLHVLTRSRFPRLDQVSETREKARKREAEKLLSAASRKEEQAVGVGTEKAFPN